MPTLNPVPWGFRSRFPLFVLDDRYRLNFHEEFRPEEPLNLNSSTGGRTLDIHVLVANLSERSQM
jgi:hypothetical protein